MRERDGVTLQSLNEGDPVEWWNCSTGEYFAEGDTAPHAICLAALKAVEP